MGCVKEFMSRKVEGLRRKAEEIGFLGNGTGALSHLSYHPRRTDLHAQQYQSPTESSPSRLNYPSSPPNFPPSSPPQRSHSHPRRADRTRPPRIPGENLERRISTGPRVTRLILCRRRKESLVRRRARRVDWRRNWRRRGVGVMLSFVLSFYFECGGDC